MDVIVPILQHNFETVQVNNEDVAIKRPESDEWMRIKIKYYNTKCMINNPFIDFLTILVDQGKESCWVIPREKMQNVRRIAIGESTSKYNKFKTHFTAISDKIISFFDTIKLFSYSSVISDHLSVETLAVVKVSFTYEQVCKLVEDKGCKVTSLKQDYAHTKSPLEIQYKCGHKGTTTYNIFSRRSCYDCKACIHESKTEDAYDHSKMAPTSMLNESNLIQQLDIMFSDTLFVQKTHEHCKADVMVKPKTVGHDAWLPIQVKTTKSKACQYTFNLKNDYPDMLVLCVASDAQMYWLFNGNELCGSKGCTIGKTHSRYDAHKINFCDLARTLHECYNSKRYNGSNIELKTSEVLNTPECAASRIEHDHRMKREAVLGRYLNIKYPTIDASRTDCILNGLSVQDKSAYRRTDLTDVYRVGFDKKYRLGENHIYWVYFTNQYANRFMVLPERYLAANGYFDSGYLKRAHFYMERFHPFQEYMFDYDDVDFERLQEVLNSIMP